MIDRRANPSYGYRAIHIIPRVCGKLVEIQVRTALQHRWAELSEKFSDVLDPTIKYGGGDETARELLARLSQLVADYEQLEKDMPKVKDQNLSQEQQLRELKEKTSAFFDGIVSDINIGDNTES